MCPFSDYTSATRLCNVPIRNLMCPIADYASATGWCTYSKPHVPNCWLHLSYWLMYCTYTKPHVPNCWLRLSYWLMYLYETSCVQLLTMPQLLVDVPIRNLMCPIADYASATGWCTYSKPHVSNCWLRLSYWLMYLFETSCVQLLTRSQLLFYVPVSNHLNFSYWLMYLFL